MEQYTINDLKAMVYDRIAMIEKANSEIKLLNEEINKRQITSSTNDELLKDIGEK